MKLSINPVPTYPTVLAPAKPRKPGAWLIAAASLTLLASGGKAPAQSVPSPSFLDYRNFFAVNPFSIAQGDLNGDGLPDLVCAGPAGVSILFGNSDGTFQAPVSVNTTTSGSVVVRRLQWRWQE